jgi:PAS domain S-box-containing protein
MSKRRRPRPPMFWIRPGILALAVAAAILVAVSYLGLSALLAARALNQADSQWTRNQKDLVIALERYARDGDPLRWAEAEPPLAFLQAVQRALESVTAEPADRRRILEAFREVPGFAEEAESFARVFRSFGWTAYTEEILGYWQETQARAMELTRLAYALRVATETEDPEETARILARIEEVDREIVGFLDGFAVSQRAGARAVHRWSFLVVAGAALILLLLGSAGIVMVLMRLESQGRELARSDRRFRQVTAAIEEIFWLSSPDKSEMYYVSPAFEAIWEMPAAELYRNPSLWLESVHPEDRERVEQAVALQVKGEFDVEYRIIPPSGGIRWIRDRAFPVMDGGPEALGIAGLASDVTEEKRLQQELLGTHRIRAAARVAAGVGHDFNNLLTVIRGHLHFLEADLPADSEARADVQEIRKAAAKAAARTRELLALGRQQFVHPVVVDLNRLLEEHRERLESLLPSRIRLVLEPAPDLPPAQADPGHLLDCVVALVANARDATRDSGEIRVLTYPFGPPGPDPVQVVRGHLPPVPHVALEVRDRGRGIVESDQPNLFEPFSSGPSYVGSEELGLPAVLGLMEQMNGGIQLNSRPGAGARVVLLLPRALEDPTP